MLGAHYEAKKKCRDFSVQLVRNTTLGATVGRVQNTRARSGVFDRIIRLLDSSPLKATNPVETRVQRTTTFENETEEYVRHFSRYNKPLNGVDDE